MPPPADQKRDWTAIASLTVLILFQTGGMIWWASGITTSAKFTADTVADMKLKLDAINTMATVNATQDIRIGQLETRMTANETRIREIEVRPTPAR